MNVSGKFIVFEGLDGSGKGTIIHNFIKHIKKNYAGVSVISTKEPTQSKYGKELQYILQSKQQVEASYIESLFIKDRQEHQSLINEGLSLNNCVISDRYYHSTLAYQTDYSRLKSLHTTHIFTQPSIVFILQPPLDVILNRIASRSTTELYETTTKLTTVYHRYEQILADTWTYPVRKIDTSFELDSCLQLVVGYIENLSPVI